MMNWTDCTDVMSESDIIVCILGSVYAHYVEKQQSHNRKWRGNFTLAIDQASMRVVRMMYCMHAHTYTCSCAIIAIADYIYSYNMIMYTYVYTCQRIHIKSGVLLRLVDIFICLT